MQETKAPEFVTNPIVVPLTDPQITPAVQPVAEPMVPPAPPIPDVPKKSNKKLFIIIAIVVALLVIVAAVAFAYSQMNKPAMVEPFPTPEAIMEEASPTPEAMVDTTGWESYVGEGYTLMYPSTFSASDTEENGDKGISLLMHGETQKNSGRTQTELFDGIVIKSLLVSNTDQQSLMEYANSQQMAAKSSLDPQSEDTISDLAAVTIAGQNAYMYDIHGYSDAKMYFLGKGNTIVKIIVIYAGSDADVPGYLSLADQILSTFKFTQ